jgi:hypothetical protein
MALPGKIALFTWYIVSLALSMMNVWGYWGVEVAAVKLRQEVFNVPFVHKVNALDFSY